MSYQFTTLADKALLVKLQRSMYQPYAYDDGATKQVEAACGVKGAGRFNKRLFKANAELASTNEAFSVLYTTYKKNSVPWLDDGVRMVPNAVYFEFAKEMRGLIAAAKVSADQLQLRWDQMVQDDMKRLGGLANAADYPSAYEVRAKFDATINFFPIPSTQDFRVDVTEEDKADMERAIKDAEANVSKYLLAEMLVPVRAMVSKLSIPIGTTGAIFRDTLIDNLEDVATRLPKLNINNDPAINEAITEIRAMLDVYGNNPDALRTSPISRTQARDKMAELDAKMSAMFGA